MDDPPDPATAPDQPDGSSRAGAEPGAHVNLEPKLAFYSDMDRDSEIVVWNIGGTGGRLLTDNFDEELHPAWSPDGTRVALVSDRAGSYDIFVVDADGADPVQITDDDFRESRPAWSPDGTRIAYVRFRHDGVYSDRHRFDYEYGEAYEDSDYDMFVTDADGSNTVRVSHDDYRELEPAWSPDSIRIAYTRDTDPDHRYAEFEIVVTRADGSDPVKLADDGHDPVWSPDGSLIAYDGSFGGIYVADPDGGDARMLVDGVDPSWSPDGTLIAYSSYRYPTASVAPSAGTSGVMLFAGAAAGLDDDIEAASYQIHVIGADGTNPVRLTQTGGDNSDPVWSPDGSRILYARHSNGNFIFVMNADGQQSLQITDNGRDPEWSPDGTRIAYTVDPRTNRPYPRSFYDVFVMSPDGSDLTKLADDGEEPSWSPAGTHVLYSNGDEVFTARSDGAGIRQITDTFGDETSWSPVWSPDGARIAFRRGSHYGPLFVMNADGSDIRQLTQEAGRWRPPVWSPDSTRIAYSVTEGSEDIAVINADATGWANLTSDHATMAHGREACQAWSSDSARIAFSAQPAGSWEDSDIWVMDADGTQKTQITDSRDDESCPVWSPDGNRFLYHVSRDVGEVAEISDIWVMNANGTDRRLLIERATRPEWSPDGGLITFMSDRDGDWEIFVMDSDGGNVTQLTFNNDYDVAPTWSPATGR